jgi:16S rRNA (uracil1498-N3)-methyltransferase
MRLTRIYLDAPLSSGALVELPKESGTHLARVLRARAGDSLILFNGDGGEYAAVIDSVRGNKVHAAVGSRSEPKIESGLYITLIQSVARGEKMDFIVQKATELGVARIVPVISQHSVVRLEAEQARSKQAHWQAVAASACEQCGRVRLPQVDMPQPLLNYLGQPPVAGIKRFVLEPPQHGAPGGTAVVPDTVGAAELAIGPEGGFAPEELEAFALTGFERMALGPRVLRTETAALAAVTWLQIVRGDLSSLSD